MWATAFRRVGRSAVGATSPRPGKRNCGGTTLPVGLSQRCISRFFAEKKLARPYACRSFQLLTKLSWQEAHLSDDARNTCATFCAAWIGGVWLALTRPR